MDLPGKGAVSYPNDLRGRNIFSKEFGVSLECVMLEIWVLTAPSRRTGLAPPFPPTKTEKRCEVRLDKNEKTYRWGLTSTGSTFTA